jgi:hypothetical protein
VVISSPGVLFRASEVFLRLPSRIAWLRIVTHAFLIMLAPLPVSLLFVAFATWAVRTVDIGGMPAFFFKIRLPTARYAPRTLRRFLFWSTSSFRQRIILSIRRVYLSRLLPSFLYGQINCPTGFHD